MSPLQLQFVRIRYACVAVLTLIFFIGGLFIASPSTAQQSTAQATCAAPIIDELGVLSGNMSEVESAMNDLKQVGADVRVRTFDSFEPYNSLDDKLHAIRANCADNWTVTNNSDTMKGNLIVYALTTHPENAQMIFYGSSWNNVLGGGESEYIQSTVMGPYLGDGNFSAGIVTGLSVIADSILEARSPSSGGDTIINEAVDLSWVGGVMKWIGIVLGSLLLVGFFVWYGRKLLRAMKQHKQLTERVNEMNNEMTSCILSLDGDERKAQRVYALGFFGSVGGSYATSATSSEEEFDVRLRKMHDAYSRIDFKSTRRYGLVQLKKYEGLLAVALSYAEDARKAHDDIMKASDYLVDELIGMPDTKIGLEEKVKETRSLLQSIESQGPDEVEMLRQLSSYNAHLHNVEVQRQEADVLVELQDLNKKIDTSYDDAVKLVKIIQQTRAARKKLTSGLEDAATREVSIRQIVSDLTAQYNRMSLADPLHNARNAQKLVEQAQQCLQQGDNLSKMDDSSRQDVYSAYSDGVRALRRFDDFYDKLLAGRSELDRLARTGNELVKDARHKLEEAERAASGKRVEASLHGEANQCLNIASRELRSPKPDYFRVRDNVQIAQSNTQRILDEVARIERKKRQAKLDEEAAARRRRSSYSSSSYGAGVGYGIGSSSSSFGSSSSSSFGGFGGGGGGSTSFGGGFGGGGGSSTGF